MQVRFATSKTELAIYYNLVVELGIWELCHKLPKGWAGFYAHIKKKSCKNRDLRNCLQNLKFWWRHSLVSRFQSIIIFFWRIFHFSLVSLDLFTKFRFFCPEWKVFLIYNFLEPVTLLKEKTVFDRVILSALLLTRKNFP